MKTNQNLEEQTEINAEMLAAISKLTRAGFLLLIVLALLFWQNYTVFFAKKDPSATTFRAFDAPPTLSVEAKKGKVIFQNNCGACHTKDMKTDLTGPALGGVSERWAAYPRQDLYQWIRNSQALIQAKHPRALELWSKWGPVQMNAFNDLADEEIEAILTYVDAMTPQD